MVGLIKFAASIAVASVLVGCSQAGINGHNKPDEVSKSIDVYGQTVSQAFINCEEFGTLDIKKLPNAVSGFEPSSVTGYFDGEPTYNAWFAYAPLEGISFYGSRIEAVMNESWIVDAPVEQVVGDVLQTRKLNVDRESIAMQSYDGSSLTNWTNSEDFASEGYSLSSETVNKAAAGRYQFDKATARYRFPKTTDQKSGTIMLELILWDFPPNKTMAQCFSVDPGVG